MNSLTLNSTRVVCRLLAASLIVLACDSIASAQNGTWTNTSGGDYSTAGNWLGNTVANGASNTANFNTLDLNGEVIVTLDSSRTIGNLTFGDTNLGSPGIWTILDATTPGSVLTLNNGASSPTVTVNQLMETGPGFDDTFVDVGISGTNGFTKQGVGILTLDGNRNNITGTVNVNAGTLRLGGGFLYSNDGATPIAQTVGQFNLANGTTLSTAVAVSTVSVAAGGTATLNLTTGSINGTNITAPGTGETLNVNFTNNNVTMTLGGSMAGFSNVNFTGLNPAGGNFLRMVPNNSFTGAPLATLTNSFATTRLNLDNTQVVVRTNSFGNTVNIGQLSGTTTASLAGGNTGGSPAGGGGSAARYEIGFLNTDSTFNGTINGAGGISLNKIGTGKLTLAGTFNGSGAVTNQNVARQGGVVRVTNGTLAITGATSIPGGSGITLTTIDVLPGATFDVSGTPGTFSTSTLQKVQGGGTIVGPYSHDEGFIRPGDVASATAANEGNLSSGVVPTAGTITFGGPLSFNGGTIVYDMSTNPAAGNDLIQVNGTTSLAGGGVVTPNFLAGNPAVGLTYTLLNSTGGFTDNPSGWTVAWPGRGNKPTVFKSGNLLQFTTTSVTGGANLIWTGTPSSTWNVETTQNWTNSGSPDVYFQGDGVTFSQTGVVKNVDLNINVAPASVTVDSTSDYTIAGTGNISGAGTFTKRGSSTLTMQMANNFSGAAAIEGGTVNIGGSGGALGTGALTMAGGTILTTAGGVTNSSLAVSAGTVNTIQADGTTGSVGTFGVPTLSGDGELTLTSTVSDKWFALNNTAGFTGTINLGPADPVAVPGGTIRINGDTTTFAAAVVNLSGVSVANQQGGTGSRTIGFGELHGDSLSFLDGFTGGSAAPNAVFEVGALNTNSDFAGAIVDGTGGNDTIAVVGLSKVGTSTLTLTGANTYTGNTTVEDGTLSVTQMNPATAGDVLMFGDAVYNLNFVGTDVIDSLFFDGISQATGTWGRLGHATASFTSAFFTGDGLLQVSTLAPNLGVIGDYNGDNVVDAADYTTWRDNLGGLGSTLLNRDPINGAGVVSQDDYDSWVANFGATFPGAGGGALSAVPEPASWVVVAMALAGFICRRPTSLGHVPSRQNGTK